MLNLELDIKALQFLPPEQQEIHLLNFTSNFANHVRQLSPDECSAQQLHIKKELLQILNLSFFPPSRVIRNNLGRCFAHVLGKGNRKLLFETVNELNAMIGSGKNKNEGDLRYKHAAVYCLGDIFAAAGDSAIGLHSFVCASLLKTLKISSNNAGLRAAIFVALGKIVGTIGSSIDESVAKDVWKLARNCATSDKAILVQITACRTLSKYMKNTVYFENLYDFDHLKSSLFKVIDSPSSQLRLVVAECLSEALVKLHSETPVNGNDLNKPKKLKWTNNKKSKGQGDDVDIPIPESPSLKKASKLVFSLPEILKQLSVFYAKSTTSNNARAGIAICYSTIFQNLSEKNVESLFMKVIDHLTNDLLSHPNIVSNRYRLLSSRKFVQIILENVIESSMLADASKIDAATHLINDVLKNYPQVIKERIEPSKHTITIVLSALVALIKNLGAASNAFSESCRDSLLQVLQHPSYTVQIHTSYCLRVFTLACPHQLILCLTACMNDLTRELDLISTGKNSFRRCAGYANGLSAMISTSSLQPLYSSVDVNSRILSLATDLLKSSSKSEIRISSTQIQVAWILIGGLMSLGPNFVKIHLPQLLILWKNALPKPLIKDNTTQLSYFESYFLTHVRECALGSILAFLQFNSRLLTVDVSKRITSMLQNTTSFLQSLPSKKSNDDITQRLIPSLQLCNLEQMTQRRVLQCYIRLVKFSPGSRENFLHPNILTLTVSLFADPEDYSPSSLSTSIASSAGTFDSIWDVGDNCGYGVTGLVHGFSIRSLYHQNDSNEPDDWIEETGTDADISSVPVSPICSSLEHDPLSIYLEECQSSHDMSDPPATEVVNAAIQLFALTFPLTQSKIQESILEQITTFLSAGILQRDPGRKAAMTINIATALYLTLKVAVKETSSISGDITNAAVEKLMQDFLRQFVIHPDQYIRRIGHEGLAKMCKSSGSSFTNTEIKYLVDTVVNNREPSARAGCAKALGSIHSQVGSMAAGFHLKTIVGVLMSLCNDPHPIVHFWALDSLSIVAESAGYNFSGYVLSCLGMLGQLYVADTHNEECSSCVTSNLEIELSTTAVIARSVNSLVNVLGPDLQDVTKPRELIMTLVSQFQEEENPLIHACSLRCSEHLSLYAPGHVAFIEYVRLLQKDLISPHSKLRDIAIDGLYNLMKRNSEDVIKAAEAGFEDQLWFALDSAPNHEGIKNVIKNWLEQSCLHETSRWLQRCQAVLLMTRLKAPEPVTDSNHLSTLQDLRDEEVAGFAADLGINKCENAAQAPGQELLRWQVRAFAMSCLSDLFFLINRADPNGSSPATTSLQKNIAEVIRMAFSASTSNVAKLRVWGLKIIDSVLKMFGKTPDPDFAEVSLLEQFQAQISSALTPAFAADSSPELASEALKVCAAFIATGIVTDIERMGRILKTLVTALENFSTSTETHTIGELRGLSPNAQVMVKLSLYSAWADLQVASTEQQYLTKVLKPHISTLTPLWLASLREFARLRFEPDISMSLGPPSPSGSLDSIYLALNRETLLTFYQESWLKLVSAIASLIEQDSGFVFDALDGKQTKDYEKNVNYTGNDINYRDEPLAFFFVLFGIVFEALVARPGSDALATKDQTLDILRVLKKILQPNVSGNAIYREAIFSETIDLMDRLVLTEGLDVQAVIVQIGRGLCISHPFAAKSEQQEEDLSEDIEQLFELTRIIVLVLAGLLPTLSEVKQSAHYQMNDEVVSLIGLSLGALVDAAEVFPSIIKTDLHACIFHIFATILGNLSCQTSVVPQSLPIFKKFINSIHKGREKNSRNAENSILQIQGCLKRFSSIYNHAQKRETEASLPCIKNILLASTIVFTGGDNQLSTSEPLVRQFLDDVLDCLSDCKTTKVAASCISSLLLQMPKTPANQSISRYLLPRLIFFGINTQAEDPEKTRSFIMQILTVFVTKLPEAAKKVTISLILPTLLARAYSEGSNVYNETSARLLDLAAIDSASFRCVVGRMKEGQRQFMESVISAGRQDHALGSNQKDDEEEKGPTIALKMNFGV